MWKRIDVSFTSENFSEKLEKLKEIYNIKTNNKLLEHIINLELKKFNIEIEETE